MRKKSKPLTAKCNEEIYSAYLMSEPNNASCLRLSENLMIVLIGF